MSGRLGFEKHISVNNLHIHIHPIHIYISYTPLNKIQDVPENLVHLRSVIEISPNGFRPIQKPRQTKPFNSKQKTTVTIRLSNAGQEFLCRL